MSMSVETGNQEKTAGRMSTKFDQEDLYKEIRLKKPKDQSETA